MLNKINHFSNEFKERLEYYITEYKDLNFSELFFNIYETETDYYFGEIKADPIVDLLKPYEGKVISFAYPPDKDRYEIYLDEISIEELDLNHKFHDGRCYIYGTQLESFLFNKITFVYHTNRTMRVRKNLSDIGDNDYLKISSLKDDYYLIGDFVELSDTGIISSTDYSFSDYIIKVKNNTFVPTKIKKINENTVEIPQHILDADNSYILVYDNEAYYTKSLKKYNDHNMQTKKDIPIPLMDLALSKRDDLSNETLIDTLIEYDVGLYDRIIDDLNLEKIKTYLVKDLEVTNKPITRDFFKDSKRNFKQPKFVIKIKNPSLDNIELFFNGKLYTDERIVVKDPYYTYIYIGIEKIYEPLQRYININQTENIVDHLQKWLNDVDHITVNLKRKDYIMETFVVLEKYNSFIFLNSDFDKLNGVTFYHNGVKMNDDEYHIVQLETNLFIMIFHFKPKHTDIITMTAHIKEIYNPSENIPFTRKIDKSNINSNYEIYYQGRFIGYDLSKKTSVNKKFIDVDTDSNFIRKRLSDNSDIETNKSFKLNKLNIVSENIDGKKYKYHKFHIKIENPGLNDVLIFYKDKLFSGDIDIIKKERYTYIYIGVEKIDNRIQHFINVNKYKYELIERYINLNETIDVSLEGNNMIKEIYTVNPLYPDNIILKNINGTIYNPTFYLNGELMDTADYELLREKSKFFYGEEKEFYIMRFLQNVEINDNITMIGYLRKDKNDHNTTLYDMSIENLNPIYENTDDKLNYLSYLYIQNFVDNDEWDGTLLNKIKNNGGNRGLFDGGLLKHFRYADIDHNGYLELIYNNYDRKLSNKNHTTDYREQTIDFESMERDILESFPDYHKTLFENPEDFQIQQDIINRYDLFYDDLMSYLYFKNYVEYNIFNENILDKLRNYERPRMDGLLLKFMRSQDIGFFGREAEPESVHYLYTPTITTSYKEQ